MRVGMVSDQLDMPPSPARSPDSRFVTHWVYSAVNDVVILPCISESTTPARDKSPFGAIICVGRFKAVSSMRSRDTLSAGRAQRLPTPP